MNKLESGGSGEIPPVDFGLPIRELEFKTLCADVDREIRSNIVELLKICFFGAFIIAVIGSIRFTKWYMKTRIEPNGNSKALFA